MNSVYTTLLLGFALGLALLIPLVLHLLPRFKAAGYARGHAAGRSEQYVKIQALQDEVTRHKNIREIERQGHQQRLEAVMQDCDDRIAIYARRANPFTEEDGITLQALANQLDVAANTYAGLGADDQARFARQMQQRARDLADRLRTALSAAKPIELPTSNRSVLVHGPMACGKTRNAHAIADALGLTDIRDDWNHGIPVPRSNALVLTNSDAPFGLPQAIRVMSFEEAMRLVEAKLQDAAA